MPDNYLYYGDNLNILRQYIERESVDLVYLDPPFKSDQNYNVLFNEQDGTRAASQIKAFEDTWTWDQAAAAAYQETVEAGGDLSRTMQAFFTILRGNDMMAYLAMMAPRLKELHRVLKPTGSIYLHCDPTASHYIKLLLDAIFGAANFRNEIVWRRTRAHNDRKLTRYGANHDIILFYSKTDHWTFNKLYMTRDKHAPKTHDLYLHTDGNLYRKGDCRAPGGRGPRYVWHGHTQNWRFTEDVAKQLEEDGKIVYSKTGMPRVLRPVNLSQGSQLQDTWTDIDPPNSGSGELLGYPTQKPEGLLQRILKVSSNEGDVVLDPFCGCGTAIAAAQQLNRSWIGIDITHLAIGLIKHRLFNAYKDEVEYQVIGEPESLPDAEQLARDDAYQFQWWAVGMIGGRLDDKKKGADQGIDGRLYFHDDPKPGTTKQVILSVKSGNIPANHIRELRGVVDREQAAIGALLTMRPPTKPMRAEAASAGFYNSPFGTRHPRIQIITIEELLEGRRIDYPPTQANITFKKAPRKKKQELHPQKLPFDN